MQFDSILNQMQTKDLSTEIPEMLSKAFDSAIAAKKALRTKAKDAVLRIIGLHDKNIPIEEAALMMGVPVKSLRKLIVNEGIPYTDACGYLRNRAGSCLSEDQHPNADPAMLGQHEIMILTSILKTPECREIMAVVHEISTLLILRKIIGS